MFFSKYRQQRKEQKEEQEQENRLPSETKKIIRDLKRAFKIKEIRTKSGYATVRNWTHYLTEIKTKKDTIQIIATNKFPAGKYYACYNPCNHTTYLYYLNEGTLIRVSSGRLYTVDQNPLIKGCRDFQVFYDYVQNDCY